jgi:hypothetical protein
MRDPASREKRGVSVALVAGLLCCGTSTRAWAQQSLEAEPAEPPLEVHGFVSQGYIKSLRNAYLAKSDGVGSFEFTEAGINFTKTLTDKLRLGTQLFTRDLGPIGNYAAKFDWFYLDYHFFDWLGLRAGRTKLPFGLYNETSDIDAARVPILLPQSVYPTQSRDYLLAQTGGELYGYVPVGPVGALEYRLYGGTIYLDAGSSDQVSDFNVPYLLGGRLMWLAPLTGLQLGGSVQTLRLDATFTPDAETVSGLQMQGDLPSDFGGSVDVQVPAVLWVASAEYQFQNLHAAAEYSRWKVRVRSTVPAVIANNKTTSERMYGMLSYQVAKWFTPGVYYSVMFPNVKERSGRAAYQHDAAATLRYDLNEHWLLKLEGHYMRGTAGLSEALNDAPPSRLAAHWGVFLLKTTAYF